MSDAFAIQERLFIVRLPEDSHLAGKTLAESRLGSVLSLNVVGIIRDGQTTLAPGPDTCLQASDQLLVTGRPDKLLELGYKQQLVVQEEYVSVGKLISEDINITELALSADSPLIGKTLAEIGFRQKYECIVLAIWREGSPIRSNFERLPLRKDDLLLVQTTKEQAKALIAFPEFGTSRSSLRDAYHLDESLMLISLPEGSLLCGKTLTESHLGDAFGLGVLGIIRDGTTNLMPDPSEILQPGDTLLVKGRAENVHALDDLQDLEIDDEAAPSLAVMESEDISMVQVALSPQTSLAGKTLRQTNFREKYDLSVLAVYRAGNTHRSNLRDMPLRFGDAMLAFGRREKLNLLADEPDFLVLTEKVQAPPNSGKAPIAAALMAAVVLSVGMGWLPIAVAAVTGAALMVLSGCLTMTEAYRAIEWKAIFLIAGMLPLGIAMQSSGTARFLADQVIALAQPYGVYVLLGGIFLLTMLASQVMPNPVAVVLMAPIALTTAADLGYSPYTLMMVVAIAASASFLSPVGHPANVLVMGPGGYKFRDYFKVGLPLVVVTMIITLLVLPVFWPIM
jgi:di/tricarboxylate transporter